jgi:hypothetical protein
MRNLRADIGGAWDAYATWPSIRHGGRGIRVRAPGGYSHFVVGDHQTHHLVEGRLADPVLTAEVGRLHPGLVLPQNRDDLLPNISLPPALLALAAEMIEQGALAKIQFSSDAAGCRSASAAERACG